MTVDPAQPIMVHTSEGVGLTTPEPFVRHVRVLLSPLLQENMGDFAIGWTQVPPFQQGTRHAHPESGEVWMFCEGGAGRGLIGDEEFITGPGTVIYTPPGVPHQFFNDSDTTVKLFFMYWPSGAEQAVIDAEFK